MLDMVSRGLKLIKAQKPPFSNRIRIIWHVLYRLKNAPFFIKKLKFFLKFLKQAADTSNVLEQKEV